MWDQFEFQHQLLQLCLLLALLAGGVVEGPVVELLLGGPAAPHAAAAALPPAAPLLIYRCSAGGRRQLHLHKPTVVGACWRQDDTTGHLHTDPIGDAGCAGGGGHQHPAASRFGSRDYRGHSSWFDLASVAYIADHISVIKCNHLSLCH